MKDLTKEDVTNFKHNMTVGDLKEFLKEHNIPDYSKVLIQRVEDVYYEKHNWGVYRKPDDRVFNMFEWNRKFKNGTLKEDYPDLEPQNIKEYTEEEIKVAMQQYHPAWCCVYYKDDSDILFIDLHY